MKTNQWGFVSYTIGEKLKQFWESVKDMGRWFINGDDRVAK